jgi:hypothetical protein
LRSDCIKDLGSALITSIFLSCLIFTFSGTKTIGLFCFIAYVPYSLVSLVVLHINLIKSKAKLASLIRNNLTQIDFNKIDNIQIKLANLYCYSSFFFSLTLHINMI